MNNGMTYKDYIGTVEYSAEDEVFYGKIHGINDLVLFEGNSVKQLKRSFKEAVEDYLDMCRTLGKVPNKSYKGVFNVRVSSDTHKRAAFAANSMNITLNDFMRRAIRYALDNKNELSTD